MIASVPAQNRGPTGPTGGALFRTRPAPRPPWASLFAIGLALLALSTQGVLAQPPQADTRPAAAGSPPPSVASSAGQDSDRQGDGSERGPRLALQGRLSAINVVLSGSLSSASNQVPLATPGVRLLDGRLFAGMGFGFFGVQGSNTGLSFSPLVALDVARDRDLGALYIAGWLTLGNFDDGRPATSSSEVFTWGFSAVTGLRAILTPAFSIGGEFGWGFLSLSQTGSSFVHGVTGSVFVEASLGV